MSATTFLLILNFITLHALQFSSENEYLMASPSSSRRGPRHKRGYTRWGGDDNKATTTEFLVQVFDEKSSSGILDPITSPGRKIVPIKSGPGKRQLPDRTLTTSELVKSNEYTRFVPQKPGATAGLGEDVKRYEDVDIDAINSTANKIKRNPIIAGQNRYDSASSDLMFPSLSFADISKKSHPERDESPPSGPVFIPRDPLLAQRIAPLTKVSFKKQASSASEKTVDSEPVDENDNTDDDTLVIEIEKPVHIVGDMSVDFRRYTVIPPWPKYHNDSKQVIKLSSLASTEITNLSIKGSQRRVTPSRLKVERTKIIHSAKLNYYKSKTTKAVIYQRKDIDDDFPQGGKDDDEGDYDDDDELYSRKPETSGSSDEGMPIGSDGEDNSDANIVIHYAEVISPRSRKTNLLDMESDGDIMTRTQDRQKVTKKNDNEDLKPPITATFEPFEDFETAAPTITQSICNLVVLNAFTFVEHHKLPEITTQLRKWVDNSPVAKWVDVTDGNLTHMDNPIHMIIVDDRSGGQDYLAKETVLVVAGLQGRDYHAISAAMFLLYELIERSEHHEDLLGKFRFWIIPVFNPDGYEYSTSFPEAREWKKNMKQAWQPGEPCASRGLRCQLRDCMGVHLDRNFEYQWISEAEKRAMHPCGDLYAGTRQLSQPETRAFTRYLADTRTKPHAFVALKEGDVLGVMYPYSHTKKRQSFDAEHRMRASHAANAAGSIAGRHYVHGQVSEFLPLYAGGIEDWMSGHLGVDNSYTVMLNRPNEPEDGVTIEQVAHEGFAALDTLLLSHAHRVLLTMRHHVSDAPALRPPSLPVWELWARLRGTGKLFYTSVATVFRVFIYYVYFRIFLIFLYTLVSISSIP